MPIKTNLELVAALQNIVDNFNTLYVMGCFGSPLTGSNVTRYCTNHDYNKQPTRTSMIKAAANKTPPVFGFDCVCLIKGLLWGWNGDGSKTYGGAAYAVNNVPDINADSMIIKCIGLTTDFSKIEIGEALWCSGHIGVYIGNGKAIECTPSWDNKVQITAVKNISTIAGLNARTWIKHGKLPYIAYEEQDKPPSALIEDVITLTVKHASSIISSHEGNYSSVNKNDNGALSIGKLQWHAGRALSLMKVIVNANLMQAQNILGIKLYDEIVSASSNVWNNRIVDVDEAARISILLATTEGII